MLPKNPPQSKPVYPVAQNPNNFSFAPKLTPPSQYTSTDHSSKRSKTPEQA